MNTLKKIVILAIVLGVTVMGFDKIDLTENDSDQLVKAFATSDFHLEETELNIWVTYMQKHYSTEEMKRMLGEISQEIGITNYRMDINEEENKRTVEVVAERKNAITTIRFIEVIEHVEGIVYRPQNYIVVDIILKDKCNSIIYFENKIGQYFLKKGMKTNVSVTVVGSDQGKIGEVEASKIMDTLMGELDGKIKDKFSYTEGGSVYGYSSKIENYIVANNDKINIDLTLNYNEIEDKSYIYLASPVITRDY